MNQLAKASLFKQLHQRGNPLVLYNAWDAGSAKVIAAQGAKAIATGSWSVAASQGYPDGEAIPLDLLLALAARMSYSVSLPVSVDFEAGYAQKPQVVAKHVGWFMDRGIIGINFEDQIIGTKSLYPVSEQAERIEAIRQMAEGKELPFFINARTDLFLHESDQDRHGELIDEAVKRAKVYAAAGADGFFAPGLARADLIERLCEMVSLPVNILYRTGVPAIDELARLGVGRVSFGPEPFRQTMAALARQYRRDLHGEPS